MGKIQLIKGIITGLSIYALGALLTVSAFWLEGWGLIHGRTITLIVIYLSIGTGLIRLLVTTGGALDNSAKAKGELVIHLAAFLFLLSFFIWVMYMEGESESTVPGFVS